jgi:phenylpyruvate tautomerase PptA (4-oxalocrotonate tautomerase family)
MTVIHVMTPQGRLNVDQRRVLAKTLTDAVLVPEVGKLAPEARRGYQVHFAERPLDMIAHGGELLSDKPSDVMVIDVAAGPVRTALPSSATSMRRSRTPAG